ncbi:MAG TPA: S41 family peptidase [Acidimicrobiia bacterium]|nr:S41 family peptidase [Acidimicrobiia bacterium]
MPEPRNLRRWPLIALIPLVAVACSNAPAPSTTAAPATSTAAVTTSAVPSTSTPVGEVTTTSPVTAIPVESVECDGRDGGLLCEGYSLIQRYYVDPVADSILAGAAATGVEDLATSGSDSVSCAIPNQSFQLVCDAMAFEGASTETAAEAALAGMVTALDPNSAYLDPRELQLLEEDQTGEVEGIGALVASEDLSAADPESTPCGVISATCQLVVISTFADGPADLAGIEPGDIFVAVDSESIEGWSIDEVTATVRGAAGTDVTITFQRGAVQVDITVTRAALVIPVVESEVVGGVGYLKLNLFTETSDRQLHTALLELLDSGIARLVLDLRDNPGGALDATVNIASEFLSGGVVVRTQAPDEDTDYPVEFGGIATDSGLEIAVLVNRGSASASEVLSAALQERERALIIGENTFGKNTVQQRFNLSNGGALKLTVARWVTADGADFGGDGVTPDISAEIDSGLTVGEVVAEVSALAGWPAAA